MNFIEIKLGYTLDFYGMNVYSAWINQYKLRKFDFYPRIKWFCLKQ